MDHTNIKNRLFDKLKASLEKRLNRFVRQEKEVLSAGNDEQAEGENTYDSDAEEVMQSREYLSDNAEELRQHILQLDAHTRGTTQDTVGFGAVVVTDKQNFFISAADREIGIDGASYLPISTSAPIYRAMRDKSKGDTFEFNQVAYVIRDVF